MPTVKLPITSWMRTYQKSYFKQDVFAGLTVGILLIPQGLAYALLAGLPPQYGLYAALVPQLVYMLLGTSSKLSIGPVAMDSILIASSLQTFNLELEAYILATASIAFLAGALQLVMGFLRLGFIVQFLSKPVLSAFTSAVALIIASSQLKHVLGVSLEQVIIHPSNINYIAVAIALFSVVVIVVLKRINKKLPASIVTIILATLIAYWVVRFSLSLEVIGSLPQGLPSFNVPQLHPEVLKSFIPVALTLAIIGFSGTISVGKIVEEQSQIQSLDANQELMALGFSNITGAFFGAFPVSGGFSRSAINQEAGAKTQLSALFAFLVVLATLLFATSWFFYLPKAVLGALIMYSVIKLIDFKYPLRLYKNRKDEFISWLVTLCITLIFGFSVGLIAGVLIAILVYLYRSSLPHIAELGQIPNTRLFKNRHRFPNAIIDDRILILRFDAQLFFGNKDFFKSQFQAFVHQKGSQLQLVVLDLSSVNFIDSSATNMLLKQVEKLHKQQIQFCVSGAIGPVRDLIAKTRLQQIISSKNSFVSNFEAVTCFTNKRPQKNHFQKITTQNK